MVYAPFDNPSNLGKMQQEIEKIIAENFGPVSKETNYQPLRDIVSLIIHNEELQHHFDNFNETIISMAKMDFSKKLKTDKDDIFTYFATGLNLLSEELEDTATPKHFLEASIDLIPNAVLIASMQGKVLFSNAKFQNLTGYSKAEIFNKSVMELFASDWIKENTNNAVHIVDFVVNVLHKNAQLIPVELTVTKMKGDASCPQGWLLELKTKGE